MQRYNLLLVTKHVVELEIKFRSSGLKVCFLAAILYYLLDEDGGLHGPLLESLKSYMLVTLTAHAQSQSSNGLISEGTAPPLNIFKSFWDRKSFKAKEIQVQLLLEPLCVGPGSQFHMSIWSDVCGGGGTQKWLWALETPRRNCQWSCVQKIRFALSYSFF